MKLKIKPIFLSAVLLAAVGSFCTHQYKSQTLNRDIVLANIDALTDDLEEVTITCSTGHKGYCFREDWTQWKMCLEAMFHPCVFTGYQADYCNHPC